MEESNSPLEQFDPDKEKVLLSDVLDRVLNTGVTIAGDITISIADEDLIYCSLRLMLTSVDKIKQENRSDSASESI